MICSMIDVMSMVIVVSVLNVSRGSCMKRMTNSAPRR